MSWSGGLRGIAPIAVLLALAVISGSCLADPAATVERVKASIVAVGTYQRTRTPQFQFRATAFVVGDGTQVATNAHALPESVDLEHYETLAVLVPDAASGKPQLRAAKSLAVDAAMDLALLRMEGEPLRPLRLGDSDAVREGKDILLTGFPLGAVLGPYPATHRGIIAAIAPVAIAPARSSDLDARLVRRLAIGTFPIFQLDAVAYPGNSGSPVYDAESGDVVGIVNMVFVKGTKELALSQPSGIAYAIPAKYLRDLVGRAP